jgi:putative DNA primase/helicase
MNSEQLDNAKFLIGLGYHIFPVHTPTLNGGCSCGNPSCKKQGKHPRINNWVDQATADPIMVEKWWGQMWPDANIGILTGSRSGLVVLDVDPDHGGDISLLDLELQYGKLPDTVETITGGGGRHIYFRDRELNITNSSGKIGDGLDVRGEGGYVVAPTSLHVSGKKYEWEVSSYPGIVELSDIPDWLYRLTISSSQQKSDDNANPMPQNIHRGQRNSTLASFAGTMRNSGMEGNEIETALQTLNLKRCIPPLSSEEVQQVAYSIARYSPGNRTPTDDEIADAWLNKYPDTAFGMGYFHRYVKGVWKVIPEQKIQNEILKIMVAAKTSGVRPTSGKLKGIMQLASIKISVSDELWDADFDILILENGTLHIPSRQLRPHSKLDYVTQPLPFRYEPNSVAINWHNFLTSRFSPEEIGFLQEFAGYCLTPEVKFEIAVWLFGPPGSGKSTFISGLLAMLGNRAGLLGLTDIERSRFGLTQLPGKTVLVSSEQPAYTILITAILNSLISGERITIERKYHDPFVFQPRAKILWAMNELPRVKETSSGLFRRVLIVKFPPLDTSPDISLKGKIESEGAGILNWALDGLDRLRERGRFEIPASISTATDDFKQENDIVKIFVTECCDIGQDFEVKSQDLYNSYSQWCENSGHRPKSITSLSTDWDRLGFMKNRRNKGSYWSGVKLKG